MAKKKEYRKGEGEPLGEQEQKYVANQMDRGGPCMFEHTL